MSVRQMMKENGRSNENLKAVQAYIGADETRFDELLDMMLGDDHTDQLLASTVYNLCVIGIPYWVNYRIEDVMDKVAQADVHNSVRRNFTRVLQYVPIPEEHRARLYDLGVNFIMDHSEKIAVRAFSMTMCYRIAEDYPELQQELALVIKEVLPHGSSGLKARGRKLLASLEKSQ